MRLITPEEYVRGNLEVGSIAFIEDEELIETDYPHPFVVAAIDDEDIFLVNSTTQRETKERYFENLGLDFVTLVHIAPSPERTGLTRSSYFDCNEYHPVTVWDLISLRTSGKFSWLGKLSYSEYEKIRTGIIQSSTNDIPSDLLIHPEDEKSKD
jgi:hypothetical protein